MRSSKVPLHARQLGKRTQCGGNFALIADLARHRKRFLQARLRLVGLAQREIGAPERLQRNRDPRAVAEFVRDRETLRQVLQRFLMPAHGDRKLAGIGQHPAAREIASLCAGPCQRFDRGAVSQCEQSPLDAIGAHRPHEAESEHTAVGGVVATCVCGNDVLALRIELCQP